MRSFSGISRLAGLLLLALTLHAAPVAAQADPPVETPWQDVITHQIEAFRAGDAPEAFSDAAAMFHTTFPDAFVFFQAIISSGYAPIMESRSHSFGEFQRSDEAGVIQVVKFVGKDQELYEAVYQLMEEDDGWKVQGVALQRSAGIGV